MHEWSHNIKKRRAQQIQTIQHGQLFNTDYPFPKEWEMSKEATPWKQNSKTVRSGKWIRKLTIQTIFSLMLLVVTYLAFQNHSSTGYQAQQFVTEVVNRPFNFQGMTAWYEEHVGTSPSILPTFRSDSKDRLSIWATPVSGEVILPFNQERNGVVLRTKKDAQVIAPTEGRVIFAGKKSGLGQTIILQHADGKETWFGLLGSYDVKTKHWVSKGEKIGKAGLKSGQSFVYIALKKNNKFINPIEVIPLD